MKKNASEAGGSGLIITIRAGSITGDEVAARTAAWMGARFKAAGAAVQVLGRYGGGLHGLPDAGCLRPLYFPGVFPVAVILETAPPVPAAWLAPVRKAWRWVRAWFAVPPPPVPAVPWPSFPSWVLSRGGCNCGGLPAVVRYGGGVVTVRCPDCGGRYDRAGTRVERGAR